jgi:sialidase-1
MTRRDWCSLAGLGSAALLPAARLHAAGGGEVFSKTVCPWTAENPRHDHAQIFRLRNGNLMLVWSEYYVRRPSNIFRTPYSESGAGDQAPCRISARVSHDRGRTWSGRVTIQENIGPDNVKQPNLVRLADGEVLFFFTSWDFDAQQRRIQMRRSKDDCETWTEPRQITPEGGAYILDAGRVFLHSSGRVILPAYWTPEIWTEREHLTAFCFYSDDNGATWHKSRTVIDIPKRGAMEPAIVERKDGTLFTLLRTVLGKLWQAESPDRGETWQNVGPTVLDSPQAESSLKRIPATGDLLAVWNNTAPYALRDPKPSDSFHRPRNPLSSAISRDEGRTWENIKNIENRQGYDNGYPNVFFLDDEALVTYYWKSEAAAHVGNLHLKIFPIDWFYA